MPFMSDKFDEINKSENFIHYNLSDHKINLGECDWAGIPYSLVHWFYDPKNDYFLKFTKEKHFIGRDSLFRENFGEDSTQFFEYNDNTFSITDPTRAFEKMLIFAVIERLKYLGMKSVTYIESEPNIIDIKCRFKFQDEADYSFFKLMFNNNIHTFATV